MKEKRAAEGLLKDSGVNQPMYVRQVLKDRTGCVPTNYNEITPNLGPLGKVLMKVLFQ